MKKSTLKSGLIFAGIGGLATLLVTLTRTGVIGWDQHSQLGRFWFWFGMNVNGPSIVVGRALSILEGASTWQWDSMAMALNALICFPAGTLVGLLVHLGSRWLPNKRRFPTRLGWALLVAPIALLWLLALCVFPAAACGASLGAGFTQFVGRFLVLIILSVALYGLLCCRPFGPGQVAEPGTAPNGGPATQVGNSRVAEGPPSVS